MAKKSLSKIKKKFARRKWTFEKSEQQELYDLARSGIGNDRIMADLGFTRGQISYARQLLKKEMGLERSLYDSWRLGIVPLQMEMIRDMHAVRMAELRDNVIPKLVHPTPQTVRIPKS